MYRDFVIFKFFCSTELEQKELKSVLNIESKIHFDENFEMSNTSDKGYLYVKVPLKLYFEDIEEAKKQMYNVHDYGPRFMEDWLSDVQENLSFVSKVVICDSDTKI